MQRITTFGQSSYTVSDVQLFHGLNDANLAALLADCAIVRVAAHETVLDANDKRARLLVVLRGALVMDNDPDSGAISKILPGECTGELSVLDDAANALTFSAMQETDLLIIEGDKLWRLIDESHDVARNLLRLLSFRIRTANAQLRRRQKVGEFYRQLSMNDSLTGLFNRAWLDNSLPAMIAHAHASGEPLSIAMVDLDHFKHFNDAHGHLAGDEALRQAAKVLNAGLRPSDFAARYGGEEITIILPATSQFQALTVAQRLCDSMQQAVVFADMRCALPHITASFGVACLAPGQDEAALMAQADAALYRAKGAGRNQVAL